MKYLNKKRYRKCGWTEVRVRAGGRFFAAKDWCVRHDSKFRFCIDHPRAWPGSEYMITFHFESADDALLFALTTDLGYIPSPNIQTRLTF